MEAKINPPIDKIRRALKGNMDGKTQRSSQSFFKERITCHGVKTALVSKISKEYFAVLKDRTKKEFIDYVIEKKPLMPRTALRYAIEKMPPELKIKAMEKQ